MMDVQQQLFGLMAVAEEHQKAVNAALGGLTAERAALAKERAAVAQAAASLVSVASEVRQAAGEIAPVLQKALGEAEGKLSGAMAAFGWRWAMLAGGAVAGGISAVLLATWLVVWWQRSQLEQLTEQKTALLGEVARLQGQAEDWAKRGGLAKLERCGPASRLCVRADKTIGYNDGVDKSYFVLWGY